MTVFFMGPQTRFRNDILEVLSSGMNILLTYMFSNTTFDENNKRLPIFETLFSWGAKKSFHTVLLNEKFPVASSDMF